MFGITLKIGGRTLIDRPHRVRPMPWRFDDGGRAAAGFDQPASGDCAVAAIATATGEDYRVVLDKLNAMIAEMWDGIAHSAEDGVPMPVLRDYLADLGWTWTPTMHIGSGTRVHLRRGELPARGPVIVRCTKHVTAVIDGVIYDDADPGRGGMRAVYGIWTPTAEHRLPRVRSRARPRSGLLDRMAQTPPPTRRSS